MLVPLQAAVALSLAAILGACLGSFINCLAYRMVHGGSVLKGRSVCPACGHTLGLLDLIPVLSWLFLRGRCRHCRTKIAPRYVLAEAGMALLYVFLVWQYGVTVQAAVYLVLACILLGLSLVDLDTFIIPNGFILAGLALWLASVWFIRVPLEGFGVGSLFAGSLGYGFLAVVVDGLLGAVAIGGGILVCSLVFDKVTGRSSLGGGDVKLFFVTGLYLGLASGLFSVLLSCIIGLIFATCWTARSTGRDKGSKRPDKETKSPSYEAASFRRSSKPFPFGPSIAMATMVTLLVGSAGLSWYFSLFW